MGCGDAGKVFCRRGMGEVKLEGIIPRVCVVLCGGDEDVIFLMYRDEPAGRLVAIQLRYSWLPNSQPMLLHAHVEITWYDVFQFPHIYGIRR